MERYICLPAYNCRCILTAPGKGVSRSTMNSHRRVANLQRISNGLEPFPLGPKYNDAESERIRQECGPLRRRAPERGSDSLRCIDPNPSSGEKETVNARISEPSQKHNEGIDESGDSRMEATSRQGVRGGLASNGMGTNGRASELRQKKGTGSFENAVDVAVQLGDSAEYEMVRSLLEDGEYYEEGWITDPDDSLVMDVDDCQSEEESFHHRKFAKDRFDEWAGINRKWVDLAVKYSAKQTLMHEILRNLDGPYENWVTVFRNIVKYSGMSIVSYLCCRSHKLFNDMVITKRTPISSLRPACEVCEERGTAPDFAKFDYIPILPRLRAWVANEESANSLFDYRKTHCLDRDDEGQDGDQTGYRDYFDGTQYRSFVVKNGGEYACAFDLFIALSTDGFEVYRNNRYCSWPIAAINLNLDPSIRFLMANVLILGFVGGEKQPVDMESFLTPLVQELRAINSDGGTRMKFHDDSEPLVRVHLLYVSSDMQAHPKFSGHLGPSAKKPCLCCDVPSFYVNQSRRYYLPSAVRQVEETRSGYKTRLIRLYDPRTPRTRTESETRDIVRKLDQSSGLSNSVKEIIRKETGVKGKTVLHDVPGFVPFESLPIDTMHLGYNISKDLMEILRGENVHLLRIPGYHEEDIVINEDSWDMIDEEMRAVGSGTSLCSFGPPPRGVSEYKKWKAAEYRQFVMYYWLVLFDGHLPPRLLVGLQYFSQLMDLWSRPTLSKEDVGNIGSLSVKFYEHFEKEYYKFDKRRAGLCKLTFHVVLHLKDTIKRWGPPVNYSQFWMERCIEFNKHRLNARTKAAESLANNAILFEAYKLYYSQYFFKPQQQSGIDDEPDVATCAEGNQYRNVIMQGPVKVQKLNSLEMRRFKLRDLLTSYIAETESLGTEDASQAVTENDFLSFGGAKVACGEGWEAIGALHFSRKRTAKSRGNFYIAAEFTVDDSPSPSHDGHIAEHHQVYYGRALMFLEYRFLLSGTYETRKLMLADWVGGLRVTETGQVYCDKTLTGAFLAPTVGDISAIMNSIGVLEHSYPTRNSLTARKGKKTFFLDPHRSVNALLCTRSRSPDGVFRSLGGLAGVRRRH